jgi:hypothetical protein
MRSHENDTIPAAEVKPLNGGPHARASYDVARILYLIDRGKGKRTIGDIKKAGENFLSGFCVVPREGNLLF